MADQKISELTAASTGASADLLHIVQGGANKKLTVQNLLENVAGNVKIDGFLAFDGSAEATTAAGSTVAIGVTAPLTNITSTGATIGSNSLTLANGVQGQIKIITLIVDGGNVDVTPANFLNGTKWTMEEAGDSMTVIFNGSNWQVLANNGCTVA
jgi:hypothetical protein